MQTFNKALSIPAILLMTLMYTSHSFAVNENDDPDGGHNTQHPAIYDKGSDDLEERMDHKDREARINQKDKQPEPQMFSKMLSEWPRHIDWQNRTLSAYAWSDDTYTRVTIFISRGVSFTVIVNDMDVPECSSGWYDIFSPVIGSPLSEHENLSDEEAILYTLTGGALTCSDKIEDEAEEDSTGAVRNEL